MEHLIPTLADLEIEAVRLVSTLAPKDQATLITLSGDLGAGKTAFTKAVAKALGVEAEITSPTFVLEKIYLLPTGAPFARLVHIDAYRLKSGSELSALGFDELMQDPTNLVVLEWPEQVRDTLPPATLSLTLTVLPDGGRTLTYG